MTRIICLANSWKHGDRCIAGIEPITGRWVRPISDLEDGRVPKAIRLIAGMEPALLDVLEIPLAEPNAEFAYENMAIAPGKWQRVGQAQPEELLKYCRSDAVILHNTDRYVPASYLQSLPLPQRQTLQLVHAQELRISSSRREDGGIKWRGTLITTTGQELNSAPITDPVFKKGLELGYRPQNSCLVTVSLSLPYRPTDGWQEEPCWKIIAGVIEQFD
jgi:hypothetical protein